MANPTPPSPPGRATAGPETRSRFAGPALPSDRPSKKDVLDAAIAATADRGLNYGSPEDNFDRIARRWAVHWKNRYGLDVPVDAHDVAMCMVDMKQARLENSPEHVDSWVDIAGYAACGGNLRLRAAE